MRAEQKSLTYQFEMIDILIDDNQLKEALSELKKAEKSVYDSWSYIGLFKRYIKLGEDKNAGKVILKALKKNEKNNELLAVYSQFLLQKNRFDEALKYSEKLRDSKYASLYSEAVLKQLQQQLNLTKSENKSYKDYYKDIKYYSIYLDAYKTTLNPIWIRNCSIFHLAEGLFDNAASLAPEQYANLEDAYFWAMVFYDDAKYYESVAALETAKKYINDYSNTSKNAKITPVQLFSLESDAYLGAYDFEEAEKQRARIIAQADSLEKISEHDEKLLSNMTVNSALYAKNAGDLKRTSDLLIYAVDRWPYDTAAILLYSDFAYESNLERPEDQEQALLRKSGLASLEMERYDNRIKIPLDDALYRIDIALKEKNDPKLEIKKLDLKYKLQPNLSVKEKSADLWHILEENYNHTQQYEPLFIQYALNYLLQTSQEDDAFYLFKKSVASMYNFDSEQDFWIQFEKKMPLMDVKLVEFAAWFALNQKLFEEAVRFYHYCVFESGGIISEGAVSQNASVQACMNMADIYFSTGKKDAALDLYGKVAGRESNKYLRSEVFYRIACIYVSLGDYKNALHAADYSLSLYPGNARAALLKAKRLP